MNTLRKIYTAPVAELTLFAPRETLATWTNGESWKYGNGVSWGVPSEEIETASITQYWWNGINELE